MSLFTPTPLSTHTTAAPMRASPIVAAMPPYWIRSSFWNPDGVELPGCVNLKSPPSYLDKSLVGDVGFDPLCLVALVSGNTLSREAAKKAGALEAAATLLDGDHEWEGAYLAAMAMQALGHGDPKAQEKALEDKENDGGAGVVAPGSARHTALRHVWQLKAEPERWRR